MRGRIQWETAFFGLLAAVGLAALLVAMLIGGLVVAGVSHLGQDSASLFDHLVAAGGVIAIAILALGYLAGGYVAARMARFDGWRQGLGAWLLSVLIVAAVAIAAWISGGSLDPAESISLPSNPVDSGPLAYTAVILAIAVIVPLISAIAGGVLGERFHRAVDQGAFEEPAGAAGTVAGTDDQPYGPRRVRHDAPASAASPSAASTSSSAASPYVSAAAKESPQP